MARNTSFGVSASPTRVPAWKSLQSIPSTVSRSSSSDRCQSRDSSINSRLSAASSISSTALTPPWKINESTLHLQSPASVYYDYDLPCEFEFLGCNLRFHPEYFEDWISHTASHFVGTIPPACAVCTVCDGKRFEGYEDPISNWRKRMIHIGSHLADGSCNSFQPDFWVVEHLLGNDLLSTDQYTWAMQHARKPKFRDLDYTTPREESSHRYEREKGLESENQERRRENQNSKGKSRRKHSTQSGRYVRKSVLILHQHGSIVLSPGSRTAMQNDHYPDGKSVFDQIRGTEQPLIQNEDGSLTVGLQEPQSQDDSTISSSSSSEETDTYAEVNCFIPPPYADALKTTVQKDRPILASMTGGQIERANQLMEELLLKLKLDWRNVSLRNHAPFSSSGSASQSGEGAPSEASKQQRGTKRSRETEQSEGPNDDGEESARNTVEISAL
ncbi:hypothetical protein V8E51_016150 [Hyaloscypha variabilis]